MRYISFRSRAKKVSSSREPGKSRRNSQHLGISLGVLALVKKEIIYEFATRCGELYDGQRDESRSRHRAGDKKYRVARES